jgi:hypothetical protein
LFPHFSPRLRFTETFFSLQLIAGFQRNNVAMSLGYSPMTVGCPNLSFDMLFNAKLAQDNMELAKQQRIIHQILNSSSKVRTSF